MERTGTTGGYLITGSLASVLHAPLGVCLDFPIMISEKLAYWNCHINKILVKGTWGLASLKSSKLVRRLDST